MTVLRSIDRLVLLTPHPEQSAQWYADRLNRSLYPDCWQDRPGHCLLADDLTLHFQHSSPDFPVTQGPVVYWRVSDLQDTLNALTGHGAILVRGPFPSRQGERALLRDPFGQLLGLLTAREPIRCVA